MKIIFIRHSSIADEIIPPLHFGYLASSLSQKHTVLIYDQLRDKFSNDRLIKFLLHEEPDLIGFSAYTKDIGHIKILVRKIRNILPDTKMVLGGVQMSLMPRETFKYLSEYIDFGFIGESETSFSRFVDAIDGGNRSSGLEEFTNLVWLKNEKVIINEQVYPKNLDELPFPRWELIDPRSYPEAPHGAFIRQFPVASIISSRGCSYSCSFCAVPSISGKKVRYRSLDNVMEEIKFLYKYYGVKEFHIEDDNFSMKRSRVIDFCERLLKENLGLTWSFPNGLRLSNLDIPTLKLMKMAGCYSINVGIESGNNEILKRIKKKITREDIKEQVFMVKQVGMDIGGFFIIGFPGESIQEMRETIKFARELPLDRIGISYFQPYPGTEEYEKLMASGEYQLDLATNSLSLHTISYIPDDMTAKKLRWIRFTGFIRFYFRVKISIKLLKEIKSLKHCMFILKRGIRWLSS